MQDTQRPIACRPAREVDSHLRLARPSGVLDVFEALGAVELFGSVQPVTRRLLDPGR